MRQPSLAGEVRQKIYLFRGKKVMLSTDLAVLYEVKVKALVQAVHRNADRFPEDFMFQLTSHEVKNLKSQFVTLNLATTRRAFPYAFAEQGVAMLSSVLRSKRAIMVNIEIMRAFARLREMMATHQDLELKLRALESKYDSKFKVVFDAIRALVSKNDSANRGKIGFR